MSTIIKMNGMLFNMRNVVRISHIGGKITFDYTEGKATSLIEGDESGSKFDELKSQIYDKQRGWSVKFVPISECKLLNLSHVFNVAKIGDTTVRILMAGHVEMQIIHCDTAEEADAYFSMLEQYLYANI